MSNLNRTISYFKRNGIMKTAYAVLERTDKKRMDRMQSLANAYTGEDTVVGDSVAAYTPALSNQKIKNGVLVNSINIEEMPFTFSIIVPTYETDPDFLKQMIDSVLNQTYSKLELILADASTTNRVKDTVDLYSDDRIVYFKLEENAGISENTNRALAKATGDYVGLLDHDDLLCRDALWEIVSLLLKNDYDLIYTDEDKTDSNAEHFFEPNWKMDFNLDYLLCNNYICHFAVCKREIMQKLMFRKEYDGAQDYDMFLRIVLEIEKNRIKLNSSENNETDYLFPTEYFAGRVGHVKKVLYHWRAHASSTADNPESKRYAYEAGKRALEDFLNKVNWNASVTHSSHLGFYKVEYEPSIFTVRKDVAALCLPAKSKGKYIAGPIMDQCEQFVGMSVHYSGYLHRAHMTFDVTGLGAGCTLVLRDGKKEVLSKDCDRNEIVNRPDIADKILFIPSD